MVLALVLGALGQLQRSPHGGARRNTHEHALLVAHGAAGGKGVVVLDGDDLVIDLGVEDVGHKAGADTLDLVRAGLTAGQQWRIAGFDGDDLDTRIFFFQVSASTADSTACAYAGNENVDFAVGIAPDFGAGGCFMDGRIGRINKIVRG